MAPIPRYVPGVRERDEEMGYPFPVGDPQWKWDLETKKVDENARPCQNDCKGGEEAKATKFGTVINVEDDDVDSEGKFFGIDLNESVWGKNGMKVAAVTREPSICLDGDVHVVQNVNRDDCPSTTKHAEEASTSAPKSRARKVTEFDTAGTTGPRKGIRLLGIYVNVDPTDEKVLPSQHTPTPPAENNAEEELNAASVNKQTVSCCNDKGKSLANEIGSSSHCVEEENNNAESQHCGVPVPGVQKLQTLLPQSPTHRPSILSRGSGGQRGNRASGRRGRRASGQRGNTASQPPQPTVGTTSRYYENQSSSANHILALLDNSQQSTLSLSPGRPLSRAQFPLGASSSGGGASYQPLTDLVGDSSYIAQPVSQEPWNHEILQYRSQPESLSGRSYGDDQFAQSSTSLTSLFYDGRNRCMSLGSERNMTAPPQYPHSGRDRGVQFIPPRFIDAAGTSSMPPVHVDRSHNLHEQLSMPRDIHRLGMSRLGLSRDNEPLFLASTSTGGNMNHLPGSYIGSAPSPGGNTASFSAGSAAAPGHEVNRLGSSFTARRGIQERTMDRPPSFTCRNPAQSNENGL